jgi:hypothetical protein
MSPDASLAARAALPARGPSRRRRRRRAYRAHGGATSPTWAAVRDVTPPTRAQTTSATSSNVAHVADVEAGVVVQRAEAGA